MDRQTYQSLYRDLRIKVRVERAKRPANIEGVSIKKDDVLFFDTNWDDEKDPLVARTVCRMVPEHLQGTYTAKSTTMMMRVMDSRPALTKGACQSMLMILKHCPPIPLPR